MIKLSRNPALRVHQCVSASHDTSLGDSLHCPYVFHNTFTVHLGNGVVKDTAYKDQLSRKISHHIQKLHYMQDIVPFHSSQQRITIEDNCSRASFIKKNKQANTILVHAHAVCADGKFKTMDLYRVFPTSSLIPKGHIITKLQSWQTGFEFHSIPEHWGKQLVQIKNVLHRLEVRTVITSYMLFECRLRLHSTHQY